MILSYELLWKNYKIVNIFLMEMAEKTGTVDKLRFTPRYLTIYHLPPLEVEHPWRSCTL